MDAAVVIAVLAGKIAPLGPEGVPSAFVKHPLAGPVAVGALGLAGDQQADPRVHGGPEKAVYAYAAANYPAWRGLYPEHAAQFVPGGFGENLAIDGMDESDICVGDVHEIGTARLQVCQPRQPCFKFALRFGDSRLPKAMVRSGFAGWYYRVVQPGTIRAGDPVHLHARPNPDFPFPRMVELVNHGGAQRAELARLAVMEGVASDWQAQARAQLGAGEAACPGASNNG